jgi:hypothetical protein
MTESSEAETNDSKTTTPVPKRMSSSLLIMTTILSLVVAFYFYIQSNNPPQIITKEAEVIHKEIASFELLIPELVEDQQKLELLEETFEYWFMVEISRKIIRVKEGSLQDKVMKRVPKIIQDQILNADFNKSKAKVVVKCKVSVEFEIDFSKTWKIQVEGDTAYIDAPELEVDDPNIPPETLKSWVLEEDLIIDGKHEKQLLEKSSRKRLLPYVRSDEFKSKRKERCRVNLTTFFKNQFAKNERTKDIKHIIVRFADD